MNESLSEYDYPRRRFGPNINWMATITGFRGLAVLAGAVDAQRLVFNERACTGFVVKPDPDIEIHTNE